jgi:hypothetical protein
LGTDGYTFQKAMVLSGNLANKQIPINPVDCSEFGTAINDSIQRSIGSRDQLG